MMKKTPQTLLLAFSTLLLLVSVTMSAQGQPAPSNAANFTGAWNTITDKGEKLVITRRTLAASPKLPAVELFTALEDSLAAQTITANPNPVPVPPGQTSGTTTLTWDGGAAHPYAEVWVQVDNNDVSGHCHYATAFRGHLVLIGCTTEVLLTGKMRLPA